MSVTSPPFPLFLLPTFRASQAKLAQRALLQPKFSESLELSKAIALRKGILESCAQQFRDFTDYFYSQDEALRPLILNEAVICAAGQGYSTLLNKLFTRIEMKPDPNYISKLFCDEKDGVTPLRMAARNGYPSVVRFLLINGANPNHQSGPQNRTALMEAAQQGYYKVLKVFEETLPECHFQLDPSLRDHDGRTAVQLAKDAKFRKTRQSLRRQINTVL